MALVGYSDSEGSDSESASALNPAVTKSASKPAPPKQVDTTGPRRIKFELPTVKPEKEQNDERPVKRAKTGGGLSGFNAMLPTPKRTAETAKRNGLGSGVSLKTSSAAVFSREPVSQDFFEPSNDNEVSVPQDTDATESQAKPVASESDAPLDVKAARAPMRFKPLSVANNKKKPKRPVIPPAQSSAKSAAEPNESGKTIPAPPPKPKVSLFSVSEAESAQPSAATTSYKPLLSAEEDAGDEADLMETEAAAPPIRADPNSLDHIASDLNLSASDRRRLFGRGGQGAQAMNIANFNMDNEYAKNEELRAAGEQVQHRAVRAVAPGKHSLQQLVNMAGNQREALEDSWAEGKRNKGEAGNKYGWGK